MSLLRTRVSMTERELLEQQAAKREAAEQELRAANRACPPARLISKARDEITHVCDGPVTPFVLICRAVRLGTVASANALAEELEARGWLSQAALDEDRSPTGVGS
jgi:hypothetical protein